MQSIVLSDLKKMVEKLECTVIERNRMALILSVLLVYGGALQYHRFIVGFPMGSDYLFCVVVLIYPLP